MAELDNKCRQQQVPLLTIRGTNYEVGYAIGRTFKGLIEDFFEGYTDFKTDVLAHYKTIEGRKVYEDCVSLCKERFPRYVREIEGMAEGSKIPFHYLFLLHIEGLLDDFNPDDDFREEQLPSLTRAADKGCQGCTSIISNCREVILGHTEDALKQITNNFYIVSAEVLDDDGETVLEKYTTLSYPGQLPGGTMGFNQHGIIYSMNSIFLKDNFPNRTPHLFLTRAILGARSLREVVDILKDSGSGTAEAFGLNLILANGISGDRDWPSVFNIEISPNQSGQSESELFVEEISRGGCYSHCNQFLRCKYPEKEWFKSSSLVRHEIIKKYRAPYDLKVVKDILSDEVGQGHDKVKYSIFKRALKPDDHYATVAVGIFHVTNRKWYLYTHSPKTSKPVAVIPINFQSL